MPRCGALTKNGKTCKNNQNCHIHPQGRDKDRHILSHLGQCIDDAHDKFIYKTMLYVVTYKRNNDLENITKKISNPQKLGNKQVARWFSQDVYADLGITRREFRSKDYDISSLDTLIHETSRIFNIDRNSHILQYLLEYIPTLVRELLLCAPEEHPSFGFVIILNKNEDFEYFADIIPADDE